MEIDLAGFEERAVVLPPKAGHYAAWRRCPASYFTVACRAPGPAMRRTRSSIYDLEKREEKTILDDADCCRAIGQPREAAGAERQRLRHHRAQGRARRWTRRSTPRGFEALIDPVAEWRQIFTDAWRLERDYFYDPGMHGVNWNEMRQRYGKLLEDAVTRWDVNYVHRGADLGAELLPHLSQRRRRREGPSGGRGLPGLRFSLENGAYRIKHIVKAADWDAEVRSPLLQPGLTNVQEGDYLLAVNGEPMDVTEDPWAAFQGLADKPVFLTVNDKPTMAGAREVLVQTLGSEERLRNLAWIEENRERVEQAQRRPARVCVCAGHRRQRPGRAGAHVAGAGRRSPGWSLTSASTAAARSRTGSSSCWTGPCAITGPCATARIGPRRRSATSDPRRC